MTSTPTITKHFEAQSHGPPIRCLRFAGWVTHRHARLASGGWPALPGGTGYPLGPYERFQVIPSSFPKLCWRTPTKMKTVPWAILALAGYPGNIVVALPGQTIDGHYKRNPPGMRPVEKWAFGKIQVSAIVAASGNRDNECSARRLRRAVTTGCRSQLQAAPQRPLFPQPYLGKCVEP
jgi:hypothetical protein